MSFPMKPNKAQNIKEKNPFENNNANYPEFSEVHNYPDPYRHVGQRINTNPNKKYEKYEKPKEKKKQYKQYPKNPKQINQVKKVPVPVTKYVAVPVGPPMLMPVVTEKMDGSADPSFLHFFYYILNFWREKLQFFISESSPLSSFLFISPTPFLLLLPLIIN